jgi:hypothetical protein
MRPDWRPPRPRVSPLPGVETQETGETTISLPLRNPGQGQDGESDMLRQRSPGTDHSGQVGVNNQANERARWGRVRLIIDGGHH